jgi:hypothetical protein
MNKQIAVQPTFLEDLAAETRLSANKQGALVRGWQSITPEVLEVASAADEARTDALTAHYLAKFS